MAEVLRPAIVPAPALRALEFLFVGRPEIHHTVAAGAVHAGRSLPPLAPVVRARRVPGVDREVDIRQRSEEHTSELQSLMRISYAVFCLKKNNTKKNKHQI